MKYPVVSSLAFILLKYRADAADLTYLDELPENPPQLNKQMTGFNGTYDEWLAVKDNTMDEKNNQNTDHDENVKKDQIMNPNLERKVSEKLGSRVTSHNLKRNASNRRPALEKNSSLVTIDLCSSDDEEQEEVAENYENHDFTQRPPLVRFRKYQPEEHDIDINESNDSEVEK